MVCLVVPWASWASPPCLLPCPADFGPGHSTALEWSADSNETQVLHLWLRTSFITILCACGTRLQWVQWASHCQRASSVGPGACWHQVHHGLPWLLLVPSWPFLLLVWDALLCARRSLPLAALGVASPCRVARPGVPSRLVGTPARARRFLFNPNTAFETGGRLVLS